MYTKNKIIYLAGFFDGEGCVHITINNGILTSLTASLTQNSLEPLILAQKLFGGKIRLRASTDKSSFWKVFSYEAQNFLRAILPYLIVKKLDVINGLKFYELQVAQNKEIRSRYAASRRLTNQQITSRMEICKLIDKRVRDYGRK